VRNVLSREGVYVLVAVRMKSSRLPLKALLDINGKPLLLRLIDRISERISLNKIIICTSSNLQDDAIESFSIQNDLNYFRGSELDVMDRFIKASDAFNAKTIVRITGDNPLTDPVVLESMIKFHLKKRAEYTFTNDIPIGTRSEIIDVSALKRIHRQLSNPKYSEYMTHMLMRPDKLELCEFHVNNQRLKRPELSLTVDTLKDINLVRDIYKEFNGRLPNLEKIISWLDKNPSKKIDLNANETLQKSIDCSYLNDL